jgi:sulfatase modifying factor 1
MTRSLPLAGGTFLMKTDYNNGSSDGEGPVRTVSLSPFEIDPYPVTNLEFFNFVTVTSYRTDGERVQMVLRILVTHFQRTLR